MDYGKCWFHNLKHKKKSLFVCLHIQNYTLYVCVCVVKNSSNPLFFLSKYYHSRVFCLFQQRVFAFQRDERVKKNCGVSVHTQIAQTNDCDGLKFFSGCINTIYEYFLPFGNVCQNNGVTEQIERERVKWRERESARSCSSMKKTYEPSVLRKIKRVPHSLLLMPFATSVSIPFGNRSDGEKTVNVQRDCVANRIILWNQVNDHETSEWILWKRLKQMRVRWPLPFRRGNSSLPNESVVMCSEWDSNVALEWTEILLTNAFSERCRTC